MKKRILLVGLAHTGAGFTRVLTEFGVGLSEKYEVFYLGLRNSEKPIVNLCSKINLIDFPHVPDNPNIQMLFAERVKEIDPSLVLLLGSPWKMGLFIQTLSSFRNKLIVLLYFPIEGRLSEKETSALSPLSDTDVVLFYTGYAKKNIKTLLSNLPQSEGSDSIPVLKTLAHGVNTKTFFPLTNKKTSRACIRKDLFPNRPELWDAFIVLNANQTYHRKRIDLTVKGFGKFAKNKSNAYLYLHTSRMDKYTRRNIYKWADEEGVADRLLVNLLSPDEQPVSEVMLNKLFNACDVGINTAMGEGWGLVSFEHAATGAPQIIPGHSVFIENWKDVGIFIGTEESEYNWMEKADSFPVKLDEVAKCLEKVYGDKKFRYEMEKKAFQHATSDRFKWPLIIKKLDLIISSSLKEKNNSDPAARFKAD